MSSYKIIKFKASEVPEQYHVMLESRFLRSLKNGNEYFKLIERKPYFLVYRAYFRTLLSRPDAVIRLAVLDDVITGLVPVLLANPQRADVEGAVVRLDGDHLPGPIRRDLRLADVRHRLPSGFSWSRTSPCRSSGT